MNVREREVESHLTKSCLSRGLQIFKFVPDQAPGMPDRIILLPAGQVVWVEMKKPVGGKVDLLQKYRHRKLREAGHRVEVVWTKEQADALVNELAGGAEEGKAPG